LFNQHFVKVLDQVGRKSTPAEFYWRVHDRQCRKTRSRCLQNKNACKVQVASTLV
jgi:hypothetical protein